jgi:hypothetical protein
MQKCRALIAVCNAPLTAALLGAFFFIGNLAISDPLPPSGSETGVAAGCDPQNVVVYQADQTPESNVACASDSEIAAADRNYLIATSTPGFTMVRQGPELAIGRLHPEFVRRLADAIREARQVGLASAGIFSAYRPPAFGVGGFSDKFNSLHTYGLAVDMSGIGGAGSAEAKLWHEIAARHGVACPYGAQNRVEWNHCQPTRVRIVLRENPLRETVTASGPIDLGSMFEAGDSLIESAQHVAEGVNAANAAPTEHAASAQADSADKRHREQAVAQENADDVARARLRGKNNFTRVARAGARPGSSKECRNPPHSGKNVCGSRREETAERLQALHRRQAAASTSRHHT